MIVTVQFCVPPGPESGAGSVQPLILSNPLCSAHQEDAAFSASARVAAVNARQNFAVFNIPVGSLLVAPATLDSSCSSDSCNVRLTHIVRTRERRASVCRSP
jgi:hypothetical protein